MRTPETLFICCPTCWHRMIYNLIMDRHECPCGVFMTENVVWECLKPPLWVV